MRKAAAVGIGIGLLAAGFGAGLAISSPRSESRSRVVRESASEQAPVAAPDATPAPRSPSGSAAATIAAQTGVSGTGSIEVRVLDHAGAPLSGVEVIVEPRPPAAESRDVQRDGPEPLEERIARGIQRAHWEEAARRSAMTDADGHCEFAGLPDTSFVVAPRQAGWRFQRSPFGGYPPRAGDRLTFVGAMCVRTPVRVLGPDGAPPPLAYLRGELQGVSITESWTPARPEVDLPQGSWDLVAFDAPWSLMRSDPVRVRVPAERAEPVTLRLRVRPTLRGRVAFPDGFEPEMTMVFLVRSPASGPAGEQLLLGQGASRMAQAPAREFTFHDLAPGAYTIGVSANRERDRIHHFESVDVGDGLTDRVLSIPPPDRSSYLVVRLLGPTGAPVRDALVSAQYLEGDRAIAGSRTAGLRSDGAWVLPWFERFGQQRTASTTMVFQPGGGVLRVTARSRQWGVISGDFAATSAPEAELRFVAPGSLNVAIEGYMGSSIHGRLRAELDGSDSRPGWTRSTSAEFGPIDRDGRAEFPAVQPGTYELVLSVGRAGRGNWPISRTPFSVGSAASEGRVAIPPLHSVRLLGAKEWVRLARSDDPNWSCNTDRPGSDGAIHLDGLPAGEYVAEGSGLSATFTLPGSPDVTLTPKPK